MAEGPVIAAVAVLPRGSAGPAVRPGMTAAAGAASEAASAQPGECLGYGFGGIVRFGGHDPILHAT